MFVTLIPPPPVPQKLREILGDYQEHIQRLQEVLNPLATRKNSLMPFDEAIWVVEGRLGTFMSEAREELKATQASGDAQAIARAEEKRSVMGQAGFKGRWIGDDGLWDFFQKNKEAFS